MLSKSASDELRAKQKEWLQDIDALTEKNEKHTQAIAEEQKGIDSNEKRILTLRQWIAVSEQIMRQDASLESAEIPKQEEPLKSDTTLSLPQALIAVLDSEPDRKFAMSAIKEYLPRVGYIIPDSQYFANSLFNTLVRLSKSKRIGLTKDGTRRNFYYSLKGETKGIFDIKS